MPLGDDMITVRDVGNSISRMIHVIEAFLLTPWLSSRANKMNPVVLFVGVLA